MKIAIIGAGPAGIFTSLFLKDFDGEISLFEQNNDIGEKLKLTGGGRMNVTNKIFSAKEFSSENLNLLKNLFKSPWIKKREELFAELGVKYKWEGDRAILESGNALKEVERLNMLLQEQKNLRVETACKVMAVKTLEDGKFLIGFQNDDAVKEEIFDIVILCGGGMFRIKDLGDLKKIYKLPLELGHSVTNLRPSLSSLFISNNPLAEFSGVVFKGKLTDPVNKKSASGEILATHQGLSGPAVLDFSSMIESKHIELAFISEIDEETFSKEFQKMRNGNETVKTLLHKFLSNRICDYLLKISALDPEIKIAMTSKENLKKLQKNLFHLELRNVDVMDYSFAWTTKGGIPLKEINVATLESRLHKNLYFAGEILDVNGLCGGYNISFATISAKIVSESIL
jgi:predicted Rossmann fold flavoprotein